MSPNPVQHLADRAAVPDPRWTVGLVEILGALGVILPWLTGIAPILTPIASIGLAVVQIGALRVHLVRNERRPLPANVLLLLAACVAVGRFLG